jgi:galactose oxidase-like protein
MKKHNDITLTVAVEYDRGEEKVQIPNAFVVAFDDMDCRIASAPVNQDCAILKLPEEVAGKTVRIFHASTEFNLKDTASVARLQRYQGVEKRFYIDPKINDLRLVLPKLDLKLWLKACCRVRGEVSMRIRMPSGKVRYAPLCNARLQIFEVDHTFWMIIKALPDHLVYRLRDEWKAVIQNPVIKADIRPEIAAIGAGLRQALAPVDAQQRVKAAAGLRQQVKPIFKLKTATLLRKAFIDNFVLLRPYLCYFDWFPLHRLDLLNTVDIAEDGTFDTHIYYPCYGDKPDLYFKVQQDCHEGGRLTVYAPSIHCSTYWNYCCGTRIKIQVSHPKAAPGLSLPPCDFPYDANDLATMGVSQNLPSGFETPSNFPVANVALMHTGDVLLMREADYDAAVPASLVWNPDNESSPDLTTPSPKVTQSLWCTGHAFLADGRLLAMGGAGNSMNTAVTASWAFNPHSKSWVKDSDMKNKRWYPTGVTLPDGRVLTISGVRGYSADEGPMQVPEIEIYDPNAALADRWKVVSGADRVFEGTYPGLHLLPSGDVIFTRTGWRAHTGSPADKSAILKLTDTVAGTSGVWDEEYTMHCPDRREGMSVILLRSHKEVAPEDAADPEPLDPPIPYARILVIGGGTTIQTPCDRTVVEKIDLPPLSGTPTWDKVAPLHNARMNVNVVLLPDGTVFVCGGASKSTPCEIYDPDEDKWIEVAPLKYEHGYHSQALLLPSGKVFIIGGTDPTSEKKIELYNPPYLFRGPRPSYTISDDHFHHDDYFTIHSPDACRIKRIGLMRPSAVTHHTDPEQRYIMLDFERQGKCELKIRAPKTGAIAPPGHYMLFIVDDCGIPSEAEFVDLH